MHVKRTDKVFIRIATSSVGVASTKLVRAEFPNIEIYGSTQNRSKREQLLNEGYTDIIEEVNGKLVKQMSFDKILELVGPVMIKNLLSI